MFKSKTLTVQDYPDKAFNITIYGKSTKSKYKLGDIVIIINNNRVSPSFHDIIGFDVDGDAMLGNCPWGNTRGGYTDNSLVLQSVFEDKKKNLPPDFQKRIDDRIKSHQNFLNERKPKQTIDEKTISILINTVLAENWYKLQTIEERLQKYGLEIPRGWHLLPLNTTISKSDRIVVSCSSSTGTNIIWDKVFYDWPGHKHNNEDNIIIRKRPVIGESKFGDWDKNYTQEDLEDFKKVFNLDC